MTAEGGPLVVSAGWIVGANGRGSQLAKGWTLPQLAAMAGAVGASVVYVVDELGAALSLRTPPGKLIELAAVEGYTAEASGHLDGGHVWRWRLKPAMTAFLCGPGAPGRVGHAPVSVVVLANDAEAMAGPWFGLDARGLVDAFAVFRRLAGVPWSDSTGHTAERLILDTHPRQKGGTLLDREVEMPEVLAGSSIEQPWTNWQRPRTVDELAMPYVHMFDANAQYLAAWGTVEVGHGRPVHSTRGVFDPKVAGFWRVATTAALRNVRPDLPAVWLDGQQWMATPTYARMLEVCDGLEVPEPVEAWIWPHRSRFFRAAAERLRDARAAATAEAAAADAELGKATSSDQVEARLRDTVAAGAVLEAVKDMYRMQTGRLGMHRSAASGWARPDWGHTIRAQARANLHRRLWRLTAAPFAIATDGLLFMSTTKDAAAFAERIGLPLGPGLGQFRHEGTAPAEALPTDARVSKLFRAVFNG